MKKLLIVVFSTILFTFSANAADMRIALVVKGLGIGFFEAAAEGGQEAAKEIGGVEVTLLNSTFEPEPTSWPIAKVTVVAFVP